MHVKGMVHQTVILQIQHEWLVVEQKLFLVAGQEVLRDVLDQRVILLVDVVMVFSGHLPEKSVTSGMPIAML